jgi:hypothetical protein
MNMVEKIIGKIKQATKIKMKKQLELDGETALRLYPTAAPEFKEMLEQNFGKEFFVCKKITERIRDYNDILEMSHVTASADDIKVVGFDDAENNVVKALIQKMRIAKVYNEGWLPKRGDRRYYPYYNVSSGFVFVGTDYGGVDAVSASASRLCLKSEELTRDMASKFRQVDENFIDLR